MHFVCDVTYDSDYRLRITFEDGNIRLVDLKNHLDGKVFEPLKDLRLFRTAHLNQDLDTVVWDNGADMSPDFLYEIGVPLATGNQPTRHVAEAAESYTAKTATPEKPTTNCGPGGPRTSKAVSRNNENRDHVPEPQQSH